MYFQRVISKFFTLALLCGFSAVAYSQGVNSSVEIAASVRGDTTVVTHTVYEFKICFPLDSTGLNPRYMDNWEQLKRIEGFVRHAAQPGDSLVIWSFASPEGPYKNNVRLSRGRGETARNYLGSLFDDKALAEQVIKINPTAENWDGLRKLVVEEYFLPDRDRVLEILDANIPPDTKKWRLGRLDGGRSWKYILENIMPRLRYAMWVAKLQDTVRKEGVKVLSVEGLSLEGRTPVEWVKESPVGRNYEFRPIVPPVSGGVEYKKTLFALKTNLLYDVASVLNFDVEVPFSERFSLQYEHHCPWWLAGSNKYCLQFLSFGGELRWWFLPRTRLDSGAEIQRDALVGHFLGVYGWGGKLDFQNRRKICYQAEFNSIGLTYGYSVPVSRRLNMEFSLSVGYAEIPYRHYFPTDDYEILIRDRNKVGTWKYFGPVKAEVTLVVPVLVKSLKGGIYERTF